jgi:metallo-beta-lactamase superfamily protein
MIARIYLYPALLLLLISSAFAGAADTTDANRGSIWVDLGWRRTVSRYDVTFDEQGLSATVFNFEIQALDLGDSFVLNAKKDEVNAALEKAYLPKDKVSIQFAPLVINNGGKLVVLDTGNGPTAFASSKGNVGQFATNMAAAGFDPKAVDVVVISHFHGDHINGLLNAEGTLAFPNAEVLVPATE